MEMILDYLKTALEKCEYKPYYSDINLKPVLVIDFELATKNECVKLYFTINTKEVASVLSQENVKCNLLNVLYFFSESFDVHSITEAKYLANRINCIALLPGFLIDDLNKQVLYRYSIPWMESLLNEEMLQSTLQLVVSTLDIYSDFFAQISMGKPAHELIEEALYDYVMNISLLAKS